jgi:hypothetical protein
LFSKKVKATRPFDGISLDGTEQEEGEANSALQQDWQEEYQDNDHQPLPDVASPE